MEKNYQQFLDSEEKSKQQKDLSTSTTASTTGSSLMSGGGLIGLAALAAIYFGTMTKK